jgi:hypothetical protein
MKMSLLLAKDKWVEVEIVEGFIYYKVPIETPVKLHEPGEGPVYDPKDALREGIYRINCAMLNHGI